MSVVRHKKRLPMPGSQTFYCFDGGRVFEANLSALTVDCPYCNRRSMLTPAMAEQARTSTCMVICPGQHGGCGRYVHLSLERAI
jgi:uncharacterized Zn-finger protein